MRLSVVLYRGLVVSLSLLVTSLVAGLWFAGGDVSAFAAAGGGEPSPRPALIAWTTGAGKWVGYWGRREQVVCPGGGTPQGAWGTDVYTDDSTICTAAVHAGLISAAEGGTVTIEMRPDVGQYSGSARNGVRTGDWMEPWTGAYVFVRDPLSVPPAIAATSDMHLASWAGHVGKVVAFQCPSRIQLHAVHGTDVYTADTPVCSASVHAGQTDVEHGGVVAVQIEDGINSFVSSTSHGVTSQALDGWQGSSYRFVAVPERTPPPPTPDTPYDRAPATPAIGQGSTL